MAGKNNKKGRGSGGAGSGASAPAKREVVKPIVELEDRKRVKSIATTQRALAYERKQRGATPDDPRITGLQRRLQGLSKEALTAASSKAGGSGARISFRSKADAARNYRARAGQTSYVANNARTFGGMRDSRIQGSGPGRGALARRATAQQPNFLTGRTDRTKGRLQPAGQRRVRNRSSAY